jgi:sterol 3beta-glucosyltransferase
MKCYSKDSEADSNGFAALVGPDLNTYEQAVTARVAKLVIAGNNWTQSELTDEPESYDSLAEVELHEPEKKAVVDGNAWKLAPDDVIQLLVQEFGPLTAQGEKEALLLEMDGALFHDVTILGVLHLTTHRLTFHASLLSSRPDLLPTEQIIKAGPAVIYRKGRHSGRRVWMQLSHDMLCTYPSSNDEDRFRPLRTVLLSSIKGVLPVDPKYPRRVAAIFDRDTTMDMDGIAEYTTDESAQDWRRELEAALFIYRHQRRQALELENTEGVRLNIPLNRISHFGFRDLLHFGHIVDLQVPISPADHGGNAEDTEPQVVRLGAMTSSPVWLQLGDYISKAQARQQSGLASTVFVDFGPLSFWEGDHVEHVNKSDDISNEENAVRRALALGDERDLWIVGSRIFRSISSSGYFVVSQRLVGFWGKSCTHANVRYRIPLSTIKSVKPLKRKFVRLHGVAIEIESHTDLRFTFKTFALMEEALRRINRALDADRATLTASSGVATPLTLTQEVSNTNVTSILSPISRTIATAVSIGLPSSVMLLMPKAINVPRGILVKRPSLHYMCLTIGSRGDVQPYIALGLGLKQQGHRVTIITHEEYKEWVVGFGIEHRTAGGDPGALMKLSVENKMFSPDFFRESLTNFRPWLEQLLVDAWEASTGADVLLESPSAMAGVHIAEALSIPYFRTFTMPWTKTTQFPHAFLSPPVESPTFNSASYVLFDNVLWTATSSIINKWRRETLKIGNTNMGHLAQSKITFIYNFSPAVVPKPLDWSDSTVISGYWFLDNPDLDWTPPESLLEWMDKARADGKPIVYVGFGSITVPRPNKVTSHIVKAVLKSDVRAIISKGWSARMSKSNEPEVEIPPECYQLDKVPHDWLFSRIDAALHHGGAGTTGASLRAGIPTLIKPWFGDQYFWASRVQKLGAGLKVPSLRVSDLADALTKATTSRIMKEKAASIGERIRSEDGVHMAIHTIDTYLSRASKDRASLH